MSGAVFDVRERLRWMLDENTCNISPSVAEGARGALEILDCRDSEIASLKQSLDELQEKYDALEDGAKNAYGLYKEYQRLEQEGLLVRLDCEGCKHYEIYSLEEWKTSKCKTCARWNCREWTDNFETEVTNETE